MRVCHKTLIICKLTAMQCKRKVADHYTDRRALYYLLTFISIRMRLRRLVAIYSIERSCINVLKGELMVCGASLPHCD